jgi:hypothetical protein
MIEVSHVQLDPTPLTQVVQDVQEAKGIGAAGDADHHRPIPRQETMLVYGPADLR